jgi:hypothetical protein
MRSVTKTVITAFLEGRSKTVQNTSTDGRTVWLHGHAIIRRDGGGFEFTLAGWNTVTEHWSWERDHPNLGDYR